MNEPEEQYWRGAVPETGLTVLFEPTQPSLDIVFIHGFTGHPERTWTSKKGNAKPRDDGTADEYVEPPPKIRKLNPFSSSRHAKRNTLPAVYWPRDLVPKTIPNARVLTYGYDTHIRHRTGPPVSRNTVYDIAGDLLVALESKRRVEPQRPVLFVVHSLGGIVVKEMLRRSKGYHMFQTHLRNIFKSTIGVMFFGTPHAGADPRGFLQHIAENIFKAVGFSVNQQIVDTLLPSAERLKELRDEFGTMAQERNWIIHSFQEQFGVQSLGGRKVVEDMSSYLNVPAIEITEHIGQNHMEMCRFRGLDDIEYEKVSAALQRMTDTVPKKPTRDMRLSLSEAQKQVLLDSLRFDQIDARQMTIKSAHAKTCKWLLKKSEYIDWLDLSKLGEHHGFLWIKGKPGAGKSTLMKFIFANARRKMKDKIIISFFFNARGDCLEKSTTGMYRSLLLQLLEPFPGLRDVFDSLGLATWNGGRHEWSVEALKTLFEQAVQGLAESSLVCFIDALDECDEHQIRDMVTFFEHVGELAMSTGIRLQVCFSSRHYPYITIRKGLSLVLEGQEGHSQDIANYLDSELKIGHSKLAEQIRTDLKEKAAGVFMWVVLVVQILNKEHDSGRIHGLRRRLQDIPGDLHELFRDILTRDRHNKGELLLCIQWVLFAKQPLKPEQLYYAILSGIESEALSAWDHDEITADDIQRFVLNSSKGLAETTKSETPTVQFIHESVRDFLFKENELKEIWSDLGGQFRGRSHERLKQCCLNYMSIDISSYVDINDSLPKASSQQAARLRQSVDKAFPFLEYATRNVLHHADAAEGSGVSQTDFLQTFHVADWVKLDNLFERNQIRRHTPTASLLYILAEHNMENLLRSHPSKLACFKIEDERYGTPIFAALATNSSEAVQVFLQAQADTLPPTSPFHDLCERYDQEGHERIGFGRDFIFSRRKSILAHLIEHYDEALPLAFLLSSIELDTKLRNSYDQTLSWAAANGHEAVVKLLLEKGADIEFKDCLGQTPLSWAAEKGREAVVKLLLEKGADIESKDNSGKTPLSWAAKFDNEAVVKLLLEKGADFESKDHNG
ncbi:uncharacterized protein F4807DRAFT_444749 [Annulohypoxylon truncatum]|uniref:uncharacterized protein n=1 Tax=Annulohypoxylon truncatum TaxID=327061 RepID=UPI002008CFE6|nr:uncharacterized protein F4807DRAFT_444749 [Annulohypoxylon truncatum]KAI1205011.1 hypothetical protein F4807DRAFT_444749 [Annulohypoxylon truncatum]